MNKPSEGPTKQRFGRLLGAQTEELAEALPGLVDEPSPNKIGICLSGGGIRSASFNLGVLQVLRERGVLSQPGYLSAVSGGSYIAVAHAIVHAQAEREPSLFRDKKPYEPGSPEETWLRNHSNYLAPGVYGKSRALIRLLAGMAINVILIGAFLYLIARPLGWAYDQWLFEHMSWQGANPATTIPSWAWLGAGILAAIGAMFGGYEVVFRPPSEVVRHRALLFSNGFFAFAAGLFVLVALLPYLVLLLRNRDVIADILGRNGDQSSVATATSNAVPTFLLSTLGALLLAALRAIWAKKRSLVAMAIAAVLGPLTLVTTFVWFMSISGSGAPAGRHLMWSWWIWIGIAILFGLFYFISDLTNWSGHPFYKRRLWSAFAVQRVEEPGGKIVAREIPFKTLLALSQAQPQSLPKLIICAAANVSNPGLTPPGRNAATFTMTADKVGGPEVGSLDTARMEELMGDRRRDISLMAASAISGAAISPSMGKMSRWPLRFLLALMNVRLGVWLLNPLRAQNAPLNRRDRPRLHYLVKELFGLNDINDRFLYVTDGGHFENLGLVELLRRGCDEIYCFDASGDLDDTFHTLGEAIAIARTDLQVDVAIDPTVICPQPTDKACDAAKLPPTEHATGKIYYPHVEHGILVYTRAAVTPRSPWDVRAFRQKDSRFPHHKTNDQLFSEAKFRAYWALGQHAAERAMVSMDKARKLRSARSKESSSSEPTTMVLPEAGVKPRITRRKAKKRSRS